MTKLFGQNQWNSPYANLGDEGAPGFDWSPYEGGWNGGSGLKRNKSVKPKDKEDKIFSHAAYAKETYKMYNGSASEVVAPKDAIKGNVYDVCDISVASDHEMAIHTTSGASAIIDMNKEKQFLEAMGIHASVKQFLEAVRNSAEFKQELISSGVGAKVVNNGRVSLWDGHLAKIAAELMDQIKNPKASLAAYNAHVEAINGGGYIVDISGLKCFMPGSLSAPGVLSDFNSLIGKTVPVMVVNYIPTSGFIVSYKKYLSTILPRMIETELEIGMPVTVKVTGDIRNGLFVSFKNKAGEWVFSGLIHRSVMSKDFEERFDRHEFRTGDEMRAYINNLIEDKANGGYRIVLSDVAPQEETEEKENHG